MGYYTELSGKFTLDRPLSSEHRVYLEEFNKTRRMARTVKAARKLPDPVREAAGLPLGVDGAFYVGGSSEILQIKRGESYSAACKRAGVRPNRPPKGQPSLRCPWVPSADGSAVIWDDVEKPDEYVEWLEYLVANFLVPWGYRIDGEVHWRGDDSDDRGTIFVKRNQIEAVHDVISNPGPSWR